MRADARIRTSQAGASDTFGAVEANARLARASGMVVHLVVPRAPGVVDYARSIAAVSGVDVSVDLRAATVRMRFDPSVN